MHGCLSFEVYGLQHLKSNNLMCLSPHQNELNHPFEFYQLIRHLLLRAQRELQQVLFQMRQQVALPRGLLLDTLWTGWLETALRLGCQAIVCNHALWDSRTVTQAKAAGMRTLSYTVNDEPTAQRLMDLHTDGIITDRVDLFSPA